MDAENPLGRPGGTRLAFGHGVGFSVFGQSHQGEVKEDKDCEGGQGFQDAACFHVYCLLIYRLYVNYYF